MMVHCLRILNSRRMDNCYRHDSYYDYSAKLAGKLVSLRYEKGWSQASVAHKAGLSTYTYQKFEKGESKPGTPMNPRLYTLLALAEVFEIDILDLLTFD